MDRFRLIGHPIVVFVLICAFLFVYFVYLKGGNPLSLMSPAVKPEAETEINRETPQEPQEINAAPLEGQVDPLNQQNPLKDQVNRLGASPVNPGALVAALPGQNTPLQPISVPDMPLTEGHWIGLEVIPLTPSIAKANSVPPEVTGVLIDEVTLLAAEVGLLAGDVITAVNDRKVADLKSFSQATRDLGPANRAGVSVFSGGKNKNIVIFSTEPLGMAQMEACLLYTSPSPRD